MTVWWRDGHAALRTHTCQRGRKRTRPTNDRLISQLPPNIDRARRHQASGRPPESACPLTWPAGWPSSLACAPAAADEVGWRAQDASSTPQSTADGSARNHACGRDGLLNIIYIYRRSGAGSLTAQSSPLPPPGISMPRRRSLSMRPTSPVLFLPVYINIRADSDEWLFQSGSLMQLPPLRLPQRMFRHLWTTGTRFYRSVIVTKSFFLHPS